MSNDITVLCTGRGTHARRILGHLSTGTVRSSDDPVERTAVDIRISSSKTHKRMSGDELVERHIDPINDRRGPIETRVYRFKCPTCGRDFQRRNDPLVAIVSALQSAHVADLDVSYL